MTNVFVVIINWNRKADTLSCLKSLDKLSIDNFKLSVIVVDNASVDDSVSAIKKFNAKNFTLETVVNADNLGFAEGNNIGINYALGKKADYVLLLNNDTLVHKDLLVSMLETMKENNSIAAVSPKIYFAPGFEFHRKRYKKSDKGKVVWSAGGAMDWNNIFGNNIGVDAVDKGQFEKQCDIDFATGACVLFRAKALREVGFFNPKYFMYFEDTDISTRLVNKKWKIVYCPKAVLWHKVAQSSGIGGELNDYFITRNRLLFGFKYASLRTKVALVRESIKALKRGRKWQKRGVVDFYTHNFGKGSWK
ncbi:glycosyltransferase family 2 protein [Candidatus Microgenomates bacterium]|nr:MAG: glycosyltransferase family 2 protein [Candidatus Microgenomates bacterium]